MRYLFLLLFASCATQNRMLSPQHLYSPCKATSDCAPAQDGCLVLRPGTPGFCTILCHSDTQCMGGTCSPVQDPDALVCLKE